MNILITGGSGFIGRNLLEAFSGKYDVLAPSHAELELTDDRAVRDYLQKNPVDVIVHSAVRPGHRNAKDPSAQLYQNSRMFFNLANNERCFGKMIFLSSGLVYDQRYYLPKMKEEYFGEHVPVDEGGLSKFIAAKYIEGKSNFFELRIFGVFGKYEDYAIRFISNMIAKALFDLPLTIKQDRFFDYVYIDDLIKAVEKFLSFQGEQTSFNVTPDRSCQLSDLAKLVLQTAGKDLPIRIAQPGLGPEYSGDNTRLKREIKGVSFTPIDQAIGQLYDWYKLNKSNLNREQLLVDK